MNLSGGTVTVNLNTVSGNTPSKCGYCNSAKGSISCGFIAEKVSLREYSALMDQGWRRSGTYYYKPDVPNSCCKLFTIRLEANKYRMRKSHKKVWKKWNRFLSGEDIKTSQEDDKEEEKIHEEKKEVKTEKRSAPQKIQVEETPTDGEVSILNVLHHFIEVFRTKRPELNQIIGWNDQNGIEITDKTGKNFKVLKGNTKKYGAYSTNLLMLIFADNKTRLAEFGIKKIQEFVARIKDFILANLTPLLMDFIVNIQENGYIGFALNEDPAIQIQSKTNKMELEKALKNPKKNQGNSLIAENQRAMEEEEETKKHSGERGKNIEEETPILHFRKLEIKFVKAQYEEESFKMYQKYCKDIHGKDKESKDSYQGFLCEQALEFDQMESGGRILQLGCYHMKYYLDGKLIAIGVVDLFKTCLSSVYFFYDPDYKHLSLGVVGAIKEIEYVQEMQKFFPEFKYYYLGFYIQNCQKMVYKGEYEPAELLCPQTYQWVPLDCNLRKRIGQNETRLYLQNASLPPDLDFTEINLRKWVSDKAQIQFQGPRKLIQFQKSTQEYLIKAFQDIAKGVGRRMFSSWIFSLDQ